MLTYVIQLGMYQRKIELMFPTPPDWSFWARWDLRSARALQCPERWGRVATNWGKCATYYRDLLDRIEGPGGEALRGNQDNNDDDGELFIQGVGKVFNVEGMSEPWKKGYFEALMGAAETAEKLDGWVRDTTRPRTVVSADYVRGPSNPNPRPPPPGKTEGDLPREENCVPAFDSPETFYLKVLTTPGFRSNQRVDAALAYADWLDFKGLKDTARSTYEWALDIAVSGIPGAGGSGSGTSVDVEKVLDRKTGVLKDTAPPDQITDNLLRASTAMGVHHVRSGNLPGALSIFLSILRARRNLAQPPQSQQARQGPSSAPFSGLASTLSSFFINPSYPIPVRTGDEQAFRTNASACEEAGIMVYIGEIIYASSSPEHGLSWTRDAVDAAEFAIMQFQDEDDNHVSGQQADEEPSFGMQYATPQDRCQDCLKAGLTNWRRMVRKLVVRAENEELEAMDTASKHSDSASTASWLWPLWSRRGADEKRVQEKIHQRRRWEAEEMILNERARTVSKLIGDHGLASLGTGSTMVLS